MNFSAPSELTVFLKLFIALLLGGLIGIEREAAGKTAGIRTYALVSMGSALFTVISVIVAERYTGIFDLDPMRVVSQVVVGIGFIGAGLIILKGNTLLGLTTAAGLWVAGGIGVAVGYGLYYVAVFATLLTFFAFVVLSHLRHIIEKKASKNNK